jgi:hypothetical protein
MLALRQSGKARGGRPQADTGAYIDFLDRVGSNFAGSNANRLFDGDNKYLSIAYAAGLRAFLDRQKHVVQFVVADDDLDLHLGKKLGHIRVAAVEFGLTHLATYALYLGRGYALSAKLLQSLVHLVKFEWFDNRDDLLHSLPLLTRKTRQHRPYQVSSPAERGRRAMARSHRNLIVWRGSRDAASQPMRRILNISCVTLPASAAARFTRDGFF